MRRVAYSLGLALCALTSGCLGPGDEAEPRDGGPRDGGPRDGGPPDSGPQPKPVFPADFERLYSERRDCRESHEHELHFIRVLVSPSALEPYAALSPDVPYPVGATLVKVEYDDEGCVDPVLFTAYRKLEQGANAFANDWLWQRVAPDRTVIEEGAPWRCINCHTYHCAPPYGYDLTCAEER